MAFFKRSSKPIEGKRSMPSLNWTLINGQWVYPDNTGDAYIEQGYKGLPNVYAIISLIISKSSIVPFEVFRVKNQGKAKKYQATLKNLNSRSDLGRVQQLKAEAYDKVEGTELERLLLNPNEFQSMEQLNEQLDGYKLLTGNAYCMLNSPSVGMNKGKPKYMYNLPSPMVTAIGGSWDMPIKGYGFNLYEEEIPADMCLHFKNFNPVSSFSSGSDYLYGMSPLMSCRMLLGKYRDADIAQGSMFKNMGPAGILSNEDQNATEEQAIAIKDRFKKQYGGSRNAGDIIVTASKFKWEQIGLSPIDLNILEAKEEILGEICNVYHVPIAMFTKTNATENNMIEARKMFITDAVIPLVEARKAVINQKLAPKFGEGLSIEYDYTVFQEVQEDMQRLAKTVRDMHWINPNEQRNLTGFDQVDDENMDKFYFPANLMPLEKLVEDEASMADILNRENPVGREGEGTPE